MEYSIPDNIANHQTFSMVLFTLPLCRTWQLFTPRIQGPVESTPKMMAFDTNNRHFPVILGDERASPSFVFAQGPYWFLFAVVFLDQVGGSLSNSIQSTSQVATELEGQNGSIDHTKVLGSVDLELGTHNTAVLAGKHTGSTDGVIISSVWRMAVSSCS